MHRMHAMTLRLTGRRLRRDSALCIAALRIKERCISLRPLSSISAAHSLALLLQSYGFDCDKALDIAQAVFAKLSADELSKGMSFTAFSRVRFLRSD
jgi:hypothetical protein